MKGGSSCHWIFREGSTSPFFGLQAERKCRVMLYLYFVRNYSCRGQTKRRAPSLRTSCLETYKVLRGWLISIKSWRRTLMLAMTSKMMCVHWLVQQKRQKLFFLISDWNGLLQSIQLLKVAMATFDGLVISERFFVLEKEREKGEEENKKRKSERERQLERLGESGATHDSQSASRSGVEAWVARNLNGWDDSDAGLSQGWVRCQSGLASLHHSRLSTRSSYQLYSFSGDRRFCSDNHGSFVYDSPNLFCGPSGSVRTGLTGVWSEPGHRTHLTSLLTEFAHQKS